jgi:ribonucleoside-diphosphate reductase alpha chain
MDYIFRWLQLRFLTGQQQALFDGLRPKYFGAPPVGAPEEGGQRSFGDFVEPTSSGLSSRAAGEGPALSDNRQLTADNRIATGPIHAADALKELIDLGDAPTCPVCGGIMTRNGSCYRCNECGSTSGCS